ncbi:hypothetical protein T484DRAFT_1776534 [Baffinella frigidus]|nr:hypothetical protein T484DRAFT_1776534 [Cryptophyta sp. CCMP2293]
MKQGEGSGKGKGAPDLEAHFADGAWYDVQLLAFDPTKKRFQVQSRDTPDDKEWIHDKLIRYQSQPMEKIPDVGTTVLAMHRSARSDLFFEGVVAEKCAQSNMCHILFSEGRARGLKERVPLKDINEISRAKIDVGQLSGWCSNKKPARITLEEDELIDCKVGEFVLIEGPEDSTWAAQLLEPYSGKVSDEVDDVDDDGPPVKLRWLYWPVELPKSSLKGHTFVTDHEVLLSFHRDTIDGRLITGKTKVSLLHARPRDPAN